MAAATKTKLEAPVEAKLCSIEGCENPRSNSESTNPWCRFHWAQYMRKNRANEVGRYDRIGYLRGQQETKQALAAWFAKFSQAHFSGAEVAVKILQMRMGE